jgi:hypothetical protein
MPFSFPDPAPATWLRLSTATVALMAVLGGVCPCPALEIALQAPLTTLAVAPGSVEGGDLAIRATVEVPAGAPSDLGVGAYVSDRHGRWFQQCSPGVLAPGPHTLEFVITTASPLIDEPDRAIWSPVNAALTARAGLFFWSASNSRAVLHIDDLRVVPIHARAGGASPSSAPAVGTLTELQLEGYDAGSQVSRGSTGERWSIALLPDPLPANPYDPERFALDAVFLSADGKEQRIPGFFDQPMRLADRGDRESARAAGPGRFVVRFRPREPGRYQVRLEARWHGSQGPVLGIALPDLEVAGQHWDGYVRVDAADPRFWSVDGRFYWPVGLNLNSTYDLRSNERLGTVLTPDRGSLSYIPRLQRFAAGGGNLVEIWMSSWNLALEWRRDWPGFAGAGRYNDGNAQRLDAILDAAWAAGVRVNLVINNHGQASPNSDREWKDNPLNSANGGPLDDPLQIFTSPKAYADQEALRRYIIARYADHPAVFGWKLWSEINLTAAGVMGRRRGPDAGGVQVSDEERHLALVHWHEAAADRWHELDNYGHGVTTHWSGDYRQPEFDIVGLPGLDYVCIDAYLGRGRGGPGEGLADLLYNTLLDPVDGLGGFNKPLLVTEYGGSPQGATPEALAAELELADWAALMAGHGGGPMLWWFEWVDQGQRWNSFAAISAFIKDEDLRGNEAHAVAFQATSPAGKLWARAWTKPGHLIGYLADVAWVENGLGKTLHDHAEVLIGTEVPSGPILVQWWDASHGTALPPQRINHPGGRLALTPPPFVHHIAFKLSRIVDPASL